MTREQAAQWVEAELDNLQSLLDRDRDSAAEALQDWISSGSYRETGELPEAAESLALEAIERILLGVGQ